jgi:hypothetical protein
VINWIPVDGSSRIVAEAYDLQTETILVRFPDGIEWSYSACPLSVWEEFTAPKQSRGQYIARVLDAKPNSRWNLQASSSAQILISLAFEKQHVPTTPIECDS